MSTEKRFNGRSFLFLSNSLDKERESSTYTFIQKVISNYNPDIKTGSVEVLRESINFDTYKVELENDQRTFILKISFDPHCQEILNESSFLRENDSNFCNSYLDSGNIIIGEQSVLYLISTHEYAEDLNDLGCSFLFDNFDSFLLTSNNILALKCDNDFDFFLKNILQIPEELLNYLDASVIEDSYKKEIKSFRKDCEFLKSKIEKLYDKDFYNKNETCSFSLDKESLISRDGLFKFINCHSVYKGNELLSFAMFFLRLGIDKKTQENLIKSYSYAYGEDFKKVKSEFSKVYEFAVLFSLFIFILDSFIEESVYSKERDKEILNLGFKSSVLFDSIENKKGFIRIKNRLKNKGIMPIINAQRSVLTPPVDEEKNETKSEKAKIKETTVSLSEFLNEKKERSIKLSWEKNSYATGYLPYFVKPDGRYIKMETTKDLSCDFSDLDLIGDYGGGVKCLTDRDFYDSDYSVCSIKVKDLSLEIH
jgi:hypothetical protein